MMLIPGYDAKAAPRDPYCLRCNSWPRCACGDRAAANARADVKEIIRTLFYGAVFLVLVLGSIVVVEIFG